MDNINPGVAFTSAYMDAVRLKQQQEQMRQEQIRNQSILSLQQQSSEREAQKMEMDKSRIAWEQKYKEQELEKEKSYLDIQRQYAEAAAKKLPQEQARIQAEIDATKQQTELNKQKVEAEKFNQSPKGKLQHSVDEIIRPLFASGDPDQITMGIEFMKTMNKKKGLMDYVNNPSLLLDPNQVDQNDLEKLQQMATKVENVKAKKQNLGLYAKLATEGSPEFKQIMDDPNTKIDPSQKKVLQGIFTGEVSKQLSKVQKDRAKFESDIDLFNSQPPELKAQSVLINPNLRNPEASLSNALSQEIELKKRIGLDTSKEEHRVEVMNKYSSIQLDEIRKQYEIGLKKDKKHAKQILESMGLTEEDLKIKSPINFGK